MRRFGHYVTVHELRRTGLTAVYSGHDDKSPEDNFAIKVLEPSVLFTDKESEKIRAKKFLNSARLQQKVVARGSQHWAPIYEYGSSPDGTFYVTNKYEHSLEKLIDLHAELGAKDLHAIIKQIAEGLIELKKAYKRPHGNLKATNVFITGDSSDMKVALSDPLSDESIDAKVHWYADLRAIGESIYQLVVHRPAPSLAGARISDSKEWAGLKKQKDQWRDLCERLLAVSIKPDAISLESLVEKLTELEKSKPVFPGRKFAVLSIVLLLIGTSVFIHIMRNHQVTEEDREDLLKDYFSWVEPLYRQLGLSYSKGIDSITEDPAKGWIDGDPDLKKIIIGEDPNGADSQIYIAGSPAQISRNNDEIIKEIRDPNTEIWKAIKAVEYLRKFFDPNTTGDKSWPLLVDIHKAAKNLEKNLKKNEEDWLQPAVSYLEDLVEKVRPPKNQEYEGEVPDVSPKNVEIFEGLKEILKLKKILDGKKKKITDIQDEIENLRREVDGYANGKRVKVNEEWLGVADEYSDIKTSGKFDRYLDEIRGFRNKEDIHKEYKDIKWDPNYTRVSELVENLKSMPENTENAVNFENKLEELKKNFDGLKENLEKKGIYYIAKNEDSINEEYKELMDDLQILWGEIVKELNDPSEWLKNVKARTISNSAVLEDKWKNRQNDLLDDDTCKDLESDDRKRYRTYIEVQPKVEDSWDRLNKLQKLRANLLQNFEKQLPTFNEQTLQIEELIEGYRDALEMTFREIDDNKFFVDPAPPIPENNDPASFKHPLWEKLGQLNFVKESSATNLVELVRAYGKICEQFRLFYVLDVSETKEYVKIFEDQLSKLKDDEVFSEIFGSGSEVCEAFSILENKISKIQTIADMRPSELRSHKVFKEMDNEARDADYAVLYAVYVELEKPSGDPNWPKDPNEWDLEQKMYKLLHERIGTIRDKGDRAEELKNELDGIFAKRKEHFEKLKPQYCTLLEPNDQNILVFAEDVTLRENFEPVIDTNWEPAKFRAWDEIKQAVDKQGDWIDFFYTTDVDEKINVGWPKYIRSKKDHSVILRFIPAGKDNPEPFYMAIREITNAQYELFLSKNKAEKKERAYHDLNDDILLISEHFPPYSLFWNNHNVELREYPVTYVTHHGAQSYATWLAAKLPSDKQHEFAFRADSDDTLPWSDQSQILTFAHVRARPWQIAVKQFNDATVTEDAPRPLGAMQSNKDYYEFDGTTILNIDRIVVKSEPNYRYADLTWPIPSSTEPNIWDLFDMIGNVWEWCRQPESICGGSCLAPPEYIPGTQDYVSENYSTTFKDRSARDVGFRVIVPIQ